MTQQQLQETEYEFPYHYIAQATPGFRQHFCDTWGINYLSTIKFILDELKKIPFSSIADIGCGDGRMTREMSLSFPDAEVVGIDYSKKAICLARAMNQDLQHLKFTCCNISSKTEIGSYDAALLMEVFEHIPPDETSEFLAGLHRLMRPGASLLVTVPHVNKPLEYKHFRHFNTETICMSLGEHFEVVKVVCFERRTPVRKLMDILLSNKFFILNNQWCLDKIFTFHQKYLFNCINEDECQRIYVLARAR